MTDYTQRDEGAQDAASLDPRSTNEAAQASGGAVGTAEGNVQSLEEQLAAAREEAAANQDRYLRARAEMDNFRKRIERSYADQAATAKKNLLNRLLNVVDNLDRALQHGEASGGEGLLEGVRLTRQGLEQVLQQEGVRPMDVEGQPFDPHTEEAIHSVNDPSVPDHTVVQVARQGYTLGDDVLRPAQVVVSVHANENE